MAKFVSGYCDVFRNENFFDAEDVVASWSISFLWMINDLYYWSLQLGRFEFHNKMLLTQEYDFDFGTGFTEGRQTFSYVYMTSNQCTYIS